MQKCWPLIVLTLLLGSSCLEPAWAGAYFDQGIKEYKAGQYQQAVVALAKASGAEPLNAMVHYYLANALVFTRDHEEAIKEYRLCYLLDPRSPVAGYCRKALSLYQQPLPGENEARLLRDAQGSAAGGSGAGEQAPDLEKTCSVIRRQLAYEKGKHVSIGEANARVELSGGEERARQIDQQAQAEISALYSPNSWVGPFRFNPYANDAALLKAREEQIRNAAKDREEQARRMAQMRADSCKSKEKEASSALDEVADNLERQLAQTSSSSGVKLQPVGTDLYVRYYGGRGENQVIPEVHPAVVRIFCQRGQRERGDYSAGEDGNLLPKLNRTGSVRGKVLE